MAGFVVQGHICDPFWSFRLLPAYWPKPKELTDKNNLHNLRCLSQTLLAKLKVRIHQTKR